MSQIDGLDELIRKYQALGRDAVPVLTRAIRRQAEVVRGAAVKLCPGDTGALRQSIHTMTKQEDNSIVGVVYTNEKYAAYVEFGTGPVGATNNAGISPSVHPTYKSEGWWYPVDGEAKAGEGERKVPSKAGMRFTNKDGVEFVSTFGQAAQPYMYPALKQNEGKVMEGVASYFQSQLKKYCK